MEKKFFQLKNNKEARDAYVEAEIVTALAHQIRAIRIQRGMSQADLAKQLKTSQAAIARLEDPSYGKMTLNTLMALSQVFDTGLQVKFISFVTMLHETLHPKHSTRLVHSFKDESEYVLFYNSTKITPTPFKGKSIYMEEKIIDQKNTRKPIEIRSITQNNQFYFIKESA